MLNKIEFHSKQRRTGSVGLALMFLMMQSISMTLDREGSVFWIAYAVNVASVLFAYAGLSTVFNSGRYETKNIEDALEDELVNSNRNMAFKYGFCAVIIVSALLSLTTPFWRLSGEFTARAILTVGVVTPMFVFSYLERDDA